VVLLVRDHFVQLQGVVQEPRPVQAPVLQRELVQEQQLVRVLEQELALQLVQVLLLVQLAHCDRCSRVRLLA
jgi:hypothetical protein